MPVATIGGLLVLWEVACRVFDIEPFLLPKPSDIAASLAQYKGILAIHTAQTLFTTLIGFALAVSLGMLMGLLIGCLGLHLLRALPCPDRVQLDTQGRHHPIPRHLVWHRNGASDHFVLHHLPSFPS